MSGSDQPLSATTPEPQLAPTLGEYFTGKRKFQRPLGENPRFFVATGDLCVVGGQFYVRRDANIYPNPTEQEEKPKNGIAWLVKILAEQKALVGFVSVQVEIHVAQGVESGWIPVDLRIEMTGRIAQVDLREWRKAAIDRSASDGEERKGGSVKPSTLKRAG